MNCESCRFFLDREFEEPMLMGMHGQCRRFPPVFFASSLRPVFPPVFAESWCGEYKPRDAVIGADELQKVIADWLKSQRHDAFTSDDILFDLIALGHLPVGCDEAKANASIWRAMANLGYKRVRGTRGAWRAWFYVPAEDDGHD
ncbi:hypothetical protein [Methylomonas sp. 11b]|uniref:hypothetical protein n=1 Tax=Methylomonas sp. 11b TaxID=1168169 RepID=UPI00047C8678|nr:hypothetical protein [Methylomonas sp. 11b]